MEDDLKKLPPAYTNLGYDSDPVTTPSAPKIGNYSTFDVPGPSNAYPQPSAPFPDLEAPGPRINAPNPPSFVFENIYDACVKYADDNCCYGKRFANQMRLTEIDNKNIYHYKLESFGEKRESTVMTTPYKGQPVDGPENGVPPNIWDMEVRCPNLFKDDYTLKGIPHTESVHECDKCRGSGKVRCWKCSGSGEEKCSNCHGSGTTGENKDRCYSCSGSGKKKCPTCYGRGKVTCTRCDGYKKVVKDKTLRVTWTNHPTDSITNPNQLPPELLLKAQGVELFRETADKLMPIRNAADSEVNSISALQLQEHKRSFRNEQILKQRHTLRAIPFTRVKYKWKEREGEFYIYGAEEKMYFENYPQPCCCCTCC